MVKAAVIGVVEYAISTNEKDVIEARYLSTGSMALDAGVICRGRAIGDTSNGFAGDYVISYYGVDGGHVGDFDWHIESIKDGHRLTWRNREGNALVPVEPSGLVFEGLGFPNTDRSIVVAYWMVESASEAMIARRE
jgi:hypothetical protein